MTTIIALAPGQSSFYDSVSGIHLTLDNKEAKVTKKTNIDGLIRAVKKGKILVVSGSLESDAIAYQESLKAVPTYYRLLAKKQKQMLYQTITKTAEISEPVKTETKVKPVVEVEIETKSKAAVEESEAVTVAEEVVETAPKKRTKKKKETETKED